jgi:hypothetical protein
MAVGNTELNQHSSVVRVPDSTTVMLVTVGQASAVGTNAASAASPSNEPKKNRRRTPLGRGGRDRRGRATASGSAAIRREGDSGAVALRSYDPKTKTWAIWWLDGRSPHHLDTPVIGSFSGTVGTFLAHDVLDGRPIQVRFLWRTNPGAHPTWEQAFSADGGVTWETNWTMEFVRV